MTAPNNPVHNTIAGPAGDDFLGAADLQRRFGGLERLYGVQGAARIRQSHVAVIGVGAWVPGRRRRWRAVVWAP